MFPCSWCSHSQKTSAQWLAPWKPNRAVSHLAASFAYFPPEHYIKPPHLRLWLSWSGTASRIARKLCITHISQRPTYGHWVLSLHTSSTRRVMMVIHRIIGKTHFTLATPCGRVTLVLANTNPGSPLGTRRFTLRRQVWKQSRHQQRWTISSCYRHPSSRLATSKMHSTLIPSRLTDRLKIWRRQTGDDNAQQGEDCVLRLIWLESRVVG